MRYISDKIKDRWHTTNLHQLTPPHTTRSPAKERNYTHSPSDPYVVEEESLYLF